MSDIVEWLRSVLNNDRSVELRCREAADTIEELTSHIEDLVTKCEQLQSERDEVRREVCMIVAGKGGKSAYISPDAVEHSENQGWDCFVEKES